MFSASSLYEKFELPGIPVTLTDQFVLFVTRMLLETPPLFFSTRPFPSIASPGASSRRRCAGRFAGKKKECRRGMGEEDRKKFAKASSYMVRWRPSRCYKCRKRFELSGQSRFLLNDNSGTPTPTRKNFGNSDFSSNTPNPAPGTSGRLSQVVKIMESQLVSANAETKRPKCSAAGIEQCFRPGVLKTLPLKLDPVRFNVERAMRFR